MIPDVDTQIQAVVKTLQDTIQPALDQHNSVAREQLQLAIATLGIVRDRLPMLHRYLRRDLEDNVALGRKLLPIVATAATTGAALQTETQNGDAVLTDPRNGPAELQSQSRLLRAAIAALPAACADADTQAAVDRLILQSSKAMLDRGRSWAKPMGFEPDPTAVGELQELL
jgi:hypothetical protein